MVAVYRMTKNELSLQHTAVSRNTHLLTWIYLNTIEVTVTDMPIPVLLFLHVSDIIINNHCGREHTINEYHKYSQRA
jgi:hypothetical protein